MPSTSHRKILCDLYLQELTQKLGDVLEGKEFLRLMCLIWESFLREVNCRVERRERNWNQWFLLKTLRSRKERFLLQNGKQL